MENVYSFYNIIDHKHYTVGSIDNLLCVQEDDAAPGTPCKHWIKCVSDYKFCYKVQKTQIRAINGASGLVDFIKECYKNDILQCAVNIIIQAVIKGEVKPAR